jgi:beta-xylosidase
MTERRKSRFYPMKSLLLGLCLGLTAYGAAASPQTITPGEVWHDTSGNVLQAHGAGMIQVGKTFYWFGEDKTNGYFFQNVKCYASTDLAHWTFRKNALTLQPSGDLGPKRVVERPKVLYNRKTHTFVMYLHIDSPNYGDAKVGVATSPKVDGPYTYLGSFRPLNHQSRDMTLFQDNDGSGYLVFEDRERGVCIAQLSPDYLSVTREVALIPHSYEAPAVLHLDGLYYLLGSHLSGWDMNPNQYATAPSLAGPWSDFKDIAPPETKTYNSQTAYILPVMGRKTTTYVYVGDRWKPSNLTDSRYIWMPLTIGGGAMSLPPDRPWTIDTVTGLTGLGTP